MDGEDTVGPSRGHVHRGLGDHTVRIPDEQRIQSLLFIGYNAHRQILQEDATIPIVHESHL